MRNTAFTFIPLCLKKNPSSLLMKEQGTGTEGDARKQVSRKKKTKKNRIAGGEKLQQRNREGRTIGREGGREIVCADRWQRDVIEAVGHLYSLQKMCQ